MMDNCCCLICYREGFTRVYDLKRHLFSGLHHERRKKVFKKEFERTTGFLPYISVFRAFRAKPFVGLSLLTFCYSVEEKTSFYLCHVCGENCPSSNIVNHVYSGNHYSNYLNYTDPESLSFSWAPSVDARTKITIPTTMRNKIFADGSGQLQVLDLPRFLMQVLQTNIYSEVMQILNKNEALWMQMKSSTPKRVTIQAYLKDGQRKHPLLGLQHIIECVCTGSPTKAYYLCTLCKLSLPSLMIVKHVLSFDHIYSFFKVLHPSTVMSKEYYRARSTTFSSQMLSFAKQSEEINKSQNTDMQQVIMTPDVFATANFASFAEALRRVNSIRSDGKKSSSITVTKPEEKLEIQDAPAAPAKSESSVPYPASADSTMPEAPAASLDSTSPEAAGSPAPAKPPVSAEPRASEAPKVPATVDAELALTQDIRCQNCRAIFKTTSGYCKHLTTAGHKNMLKKYFHKEFTCSPIGPTPKVEWTHRIELFLHLKEGLSTNTPVVGLPLIVACISTEAEVKPVYLCFACKDCLRENRLTLHLNSTKHLIQVLLYHNPWRLPFAWENELDVTPLRITAIEEEKERPDLMLVKILDVPYKIFFKFCHSFEKVMRVLELYHTLLMHKVPKRETYRKLNNQDRFPLLGQEFLVMHHMSELQYEDTDVAFLCLLCERTLLHEESYAHVFSREHITLFLEKFHPGTLNSDAASELLDLARQAARIHPVSHIQVIRGEWPAGKPYNYQNAKSVLASLKHKECRGHLLPVIVPKGKLVSRITTENMDQKQYCKSSQDGLEMQTCEKHLHRSDAENIPAGPSAEIPPSSENESNNEKVLILQSCTEPIKNGCGDTPRVIKEEKIEATIKQEPTETSTECFLHAACDIEVKTEVEWIGAESVSWVDLVDAAGQRARPGKSFDAAKSGEEMSCEEKYRTERHFTLKQEPSSEDLVTLPSIKNEKNNADNAVGTGPGHETLINRGLAEPEGQAQQDIHPELNPPSAVSAVQPMSVLEVENMETEEDAEVHHHSVNESLAVENEGISNTAGSPTKVKVSASASNTSSSLFRSNKEQSKPVDLTSSTGARPDSSGNGSNANLRQKTTAAPKTSAACKIVGNSQSKKRADCDVTTSTKSKSSTANPSHQIRRPSSSKEITKSNQSTSIGIHKSKETRCKIAATSTKRRATSDDDAQLPKKSKSSESEVRCQTVHLPSPTTASADHGGTEASPGMLNSVQTHADVSPECSREAPHSTSQGSVGPEQKNPANQPSCDSVGKPAKKAAVGLNQLIVVSCQSKRQVYCKLCSVKLNGSSHIKEDRHKLNYVKKFFGVTEKLTPEVLDKVVSSLSEAERDLGSRSCQTINVSMDTYKELQDLSATEALANLKEMLAHKDSRAWSTVTQSAAGFLSTDDEMEPALKRDISKGVHQTDRVTATRKSECVESSGQLSSCPTSSRDDGAGPTGVQDVERAGLSVGTHLPQYEKKDAFHDGRDRPACSDKRQKLERSRGGLQVKQRLSGSAHTSLGKVSSLDLLSSAPGNSEQQNRQRTEHASEPVPRSSVENKGVSVAKSHSLSRISIGERVHTSSNLSVLLMVQQTPVVGLSSIWECRGISSSQLPSFYFCESCVEKLSIELICKHMSSTSHQLSYLTKHYPRDMLFWGEKDLLHTAKLCGLKDVVSLLSKHEFYAKMDAQVVLLREDLYKCIHAAPVHKALKLVQSIRRGPNPELSRALQEYDKRRKDEEHLLDGDKRGSMLDPMDVLSVSGKTDAVVSSVVGPNAPPTPQDTGKKISLEPESEAEVYTYQKSVPESPSSSLSPQHSITMSPADESLVPLISEAQFDDASVSQSNTQPSTRSDLDSKQTSHASTSTFLLSNKDTSLTQHLISLIKTMKHAGENSSPQHSVEISCLQPSSQMKLGRWDSMERKIPVTPIFPFASSAASTEDRLVGYVTLPEEFVPYSVSPNDMSEKQPAKNVLSQSMDKNESQVTSTLGVEGNQIPSVVHQTVNDTHRQVSSSAEAVNATPGSNASGVSHFDQIVSGQEAKGFGQLGSQTPTGGIGLEVQQQQMQQQMLQLLHQQQMLQQQIQFQMQHQMNRLQMQQPQMHQAHQYQMYPQPSNQDQVQQLQQLQQLFHQYQTYSHQMQQQMYPYAMYPQQQSNQDQVQQYYSPYYTGTSMAPNQSNPPLPAQATVEYNIQKISPAQHDNLVRQNISSSSHGEYYSSPSTTPSVPSASREDNSYSHFWPS